MGPVKGTCYICGANYKYTPLYDVVKYSVTSKGDHKTTKKRVCHHCADALNMLDIFIENREPPEKETGDFN